MKWTIEHDGEIYELKMDEFKFVILHEGNEIGDVSEWYGGVGWPWQLKDLRDAFEDKIDQYASAEAERTEINDEPQSVFTAFWQDGKDQYFNPITTVKANGIADARERVESYLRDHHHMEYAYSNWIASGRLIGEMNEDGDIVGKVEAGKLKEI